MLETIDKFKFFKRFVDDILCSFGCDVNLDAVLAKFNDCHLDVDFKCEKVVNGQISFLDVNINK